MPSPSSHNPERIVEYPLIDAGWTRRERNDEIINLNLECARFSKVFDTRVWTQFWRAQDRAVESTLIAVALVRTSRTKEAETVRARYRAAKTRIEQALQQRILTWKRAGKTGTERAPGRDYAL